VKSLTAILAPPVLCLGLLGAIVAQKSTHAKPADAEGYHLRAKESIAALAYTIGDAQAGIWNGQEVEPTKEAVRLLKPNIILSRRYADADKRVCDVLIVQCRDSRDMVGHYPENCYPNGGETLVRREERDWTIDGVTIKGTEYAFERFSRGQPLRRVVYNFLVVPGVGIVPDIKGVNKAAEDYQRRHFGAAQFQFVMSDDLSREDRDRIFTTLMGSNLGVLATLNDVKLK
jgi:hypothetical protein